MFHTRLRGNCWPQRSFPLDHRNTYKMPEYMQYVPQFDKHENAAGTAQCIPGRPVHAKTKSDKGKSSPPKAAQYSLASGGAFPPFRAAALAYRCS